MVWGLKAKAIYRAVESHERGGQDAKEISYATEVWTGWREGNTLKRE